MLLQSLLRHTACVLCLSALSAADRVIMHACGFLQDLDPLSTLPKLQHLSLLDNPVTKQPNYRCVSFRCIMPGQCCIQKHVYSIICYKDLVAVTSWSNKLSPCASSAYLRIKLVALHFRNKVPYPSMLWLPVLHLACLLCLPSICEPIPHACRLYVIHRCKKLKQLDFRKVKQKEREEAAKVIGAAQQPADAAAQEKATTFEPDEDLAQAEAATAAAQQQVRILLCDGPCFWLLPLISHAVILTHCLTLLVLRGCHVTYWQPAATPSVNSQ